MLGVRQYESCVSMPRRLRAGSSHLAFSLLRARLTTVTSRSAGPRLAPPHPPRADYLLFVPVSKAEIVPDLHRACLGIRQSATKTLQRLRRKHLVQRNTISQPKILSRFAVRRRQVLLQPRAHCIIHAMPWLHLMFMCGFTQHMRTHRVPRTPRDTLRG